MSERLIIRKTVRPAGILLVLLAGLPVLFFLSGCGANMVPSRDPWYAQHYYVMQKFEQDVYKKLSAPARLQFQELFWQARSPEVRRLFEARIDHVNKAFQKENRYQPWNTDRARVFLLNGRPIAVDYKQNNDWAMKTVGGVDTRGAAGAGDRTGEDVSAMTSEVWTYEYNGQYIYYTFNYAQGNQWRMQNRSDQARYLGEMQDHNRSSVFGPLDEGGYRARLQALLEVK